MIGRSPHIVKGMMPRHLCLVIIKAMRFAQLLQESQDFFFLYILACAMVNIRDIRVIYYPFKEILPL